MLQDIPAVDSAKLASNPVDEKYNTLQADLRLLAKGDPTYKVCRLQLQLPLFGFESQWNAGSPCVGWFRPSLLDASRVAVPDEQANLSHAMYLRMVLLWIDGYRLHFS
jgi:hypothetical protein